MQEAFEYWKEKLTTFPVLAFPGFDSPDTFSVALRIFLSEKKEDGKVHPV